MAASGRAAGGAAGCGQAIVWRNVALMGLLHLGAVYALSLVPRAQLLTLLWGECGGGAGPRRASDGAGDRGRLPGVRGLGAAPARLEAEGFPCGAGRGGTRRVLFSVCSSSRRPALGEAGGARPRAGGGRARRRARSRPAPAPLPGRRGRAGPPVAAETGGTLPLVTFIILAKVICS